MFKYTSFRCCPLLSLEMFFRRSPFLVPNVYVLFSINGDGLIHFIPPHPLLLSIFLDPTLLNPSSRSAFFVVTFSQLLKSVVHSQFSLWLNYPSFNFVTVRFCAFVSDGQQVAATRHEPQGGDPTTVDRRVGAAHPTACQCRRPHPFFRCNSRRKHAKKPIENWTEEINFLCLQWYN